MQTHNIHVRRLPKSGQGASYRSSLSSVDTRLPRTATLDFSCAPLLSEAASAALRLFSSDVLFRIRLGEMKREQDIFGSESDQFLDGA